jgi:hypothetical protein
MDQTANSFGQVGPDSRRMTLEGQVGRPPCPANSYCPDGINVMACPTNTVSVAYSTKPSDCKTALGPPPPRQPRYLCLCPLS